MSQLAMFDEPRRTRARARGETASVACTEKAERVSDFDAEKACAWVLSHLAKYGPTSSEYLTDGMKLAGMVPHDDRAFGQVYRKLSTDKVIVKCGSCDRIKGHGTSGGRIWRLR